VFDSRQGQESFLSSIVYRPALWPTKPPSYPMGTGGSFPGSKAAGGVKLTTHLHLVPMVELYLQSPIRLHGVVFN
jgi:hypothetical protein